MLARLILLFLVTAAVYTGSRSVSLGASLSRFLSRLGVGNSGGAHGRIGYVYDQLDRLAACSLHQRRTELVYARQGTPPLLTTEGLNTALVERFVLWQHRPPSGLPVPEEVRGRFSLPPAFFAQTVEAAVPVDVRMVQALRRHPLAFDVYAWATHTAYRLDRAGEPSVTIAWSQLHAQFGYPMGRAKAFAQAFLRALRLVKVAWPLLRYHTKQGRLVFETMRPHVGHRLD